MYVTSRSNFKFCTTFPLYLLFSPISFLCIYYIEIESSSCLTLLCPPTTQFYIIVLFTIELHTHKRFCFQNYTFKRCRLSVSVPGGLVWWSTDVITLRNNKIIMSTAELVTTLVLLSLMTTQIDSQRGKITLYSTITTMVYFSITRRRWLANINQT